MSSDFEEHLANTQLESLFRDLGAVDPATLARMVTHFTLGEGEKRDQIVLKYFGKEGVRRIAEFIAHLLLEAPELPGNPRMLDVGAGSGLFTVEVARSVRSKHGKARVYAMDLTPAMLRLLAKKNAGITPFIGIAENITGSIRRVRDCLQVPTKFDAVFSTLMLHHSTEPERVFQSIQKVLKTDGKAVIVDLVEHDFKEFKTEMGDLHLGFRLADIRDMAEKHFAYVRVEKVTGICCESSGRSAQIFAALVRRSA